MQLQASAVAEQGCNADNDNHSPVGGVSDGTGPRSDSSPASSSSVSLTCPECGQTFRRREHLIRHLDRHSGRRSYTCDVCKTSFSRRPAPCTKCTTKGRRCLYQPNPGDDETETILVSQPAADDAVSATHSSPSQQLQPLTPMSCVPVQPWLGPDLSWDTLLTSAQFLLPFSPVPSLEVGTLPDLCFGDATLAAAGQSADDQSVQTSFGAEATQRGAVEAVEVFVGPDNLTAEEEDALIAENIPHVPPMTEETRAYIIQAIQARLPQHEAQELDVNFPSLRHLDTYMR
ncbi:hypothetical protein IL306_013233 [Fusarium sp. DS 682]|nr:hypothetical protein IL306_013233 [Fusarium sp. DS 682]